MYLALEKVDKEFTFSTTKDGTKIIEYSSDQFTTLALNGFVDDVDSDLLAYWGFLITTKLGNESMGKLTFVEFNEQYPNSKWNMDLQEFQNLVTITTVGNTTSITDYIKEREHNEFKTGDYVLVKNMYCRLQDTGVCPDQLEQYKENLNCNKCDKVGSFFLVDEKYEFGLCYKCLLDIYNKPNQVVKMTEKEVEKYHLERENQCYDLWCHKGHLRNGYERNGEVCNRTHPYQNSHDEMVGYYRIVDGVRYDYKKDKNTDSYQEVRRNESEDSNYHLIAFNDFISMIEKGIIHHEKYVYPIKQVRFTYTAKVPEEFQQSKDIVGLAWDILKDTINETQAPEEIFKVEVLK